MSDDKSVLLQIDGLMQERCNSIADTLELHISCTNPSRSWLDVYQGLERHNLKAMITDAMT